MKFGNIGVIGREQQHRRCYDSNQRIPQIKKKIYTKRYGLCRIYIVALIGGKGIGAACFALGKQCIESLLVSRVICDTYTSKACKPFLGAFIAWSVNDSFYEETNDQEKDEVITAIIIKLHKFTRKNTICTNTSKNHQIFQNTVQRISIGNIKYRLSTYFGIDVESGNTIMVEATRHNKVKH